MDERKNPYELFALAYLVPSASFAFLLWFFTPLGLLTAWMVACNLIAFGLWGYDKWQAKREGVRVPERILHFAAFTGAAPASWAAMQYFRHKTLKRSFTVLYPVLMVLQLALLLYWVLPPLR